MSFVNLSYAASVHSRNDAAHGVFLLSSQRHVLSVMPQGEKSLQKHQYVRQCPERENQESEARTKDDSYLFAR